MSGFDALDYAIRDAVWDGTLEINWNRGRVGDYIVIADEHGVIRVAFNEEDVVEIIERAGVSWNIARQFYNSERMS